LPGAAGVSEVMTMAFPEIGKYPLSYPGPYEENMGRCIAGLLHLFRGRVPDPESVARVIELATTPDRWSAGHAVFDEVRTRLLAAIDAKDEPRQAQYSFEELCCEAIYNAAEPNDPFDPSSPFFVAGAALGLAKVVGVPISSVVAVMVSEP
jgi:hypothetical protein